MISIILTSNCNIDEFEAAVTYFNVWLKDKFRNSKTFGNMCFECSSNGYVLTALTYFGTDNYLNNFINYVKIFDWSKDSWVQLIISKGGPFEIINIRSNDNVS
jgi:hypothetical protein